MREQWPDVFASIFVACVVAFVIHEATSCQRYELCVQSAHDAHACGAP